MSAEEEQYEGKKARGVHRTSPTYTPLIPLCRKLMLSQLVMAHGPGSAPATKLLADSFATQTPQAIVLFSSAPFGLYMFIF